MSPYQMHFPERGELHEFSRRCLIKTPPEKNVNQSAESGQFSDTRPWRVPPQ
jgi:hypothetical protein